MEDLNRTQRLLIQYTEKLRYNKNLRVTQRTKKNHKLKEKR